MNKPKFLYFDQFLITESAENISIASKLKSYLDRVELISDENNSDDYLEPVISSDSIYEFKQNFVERLSEDYKKYIPKILGYDNSEFISDIYNKLPEIEESNDIEFNNVSGSSTIEFNDSSKIDINYLYKGSSLTEDNEIVYDIDDIYYHS